MIFEKRYINFWIFTIGVVLALTLPTLVQDGMFQDAMFYSSISHNLSNGIGTFWFPVYSKLNIDGLSSIHEHPPLVFGIQSIFYKILGDSIYVERLYTFLMMCIAGYLIFYLWNTIFQNHSNYKKLAFLPIFFWIGFPVCFWSYCNNMQENTMLVFDLIAIIFLYNASINENNKIIKYIVAAFFIFLATMCKGIPGFFPITFPAIIWLIYRKQTIWQTVWQTTILISIPICIYLVLFMFPESGRSLHIYLFDRALFRIGTMPTTEHHWDILWRLFTESIPPIIVMIIIFLIAKFKKIKYQDTSYLKDSLLFIGIGLSASIPLSMTLVQKGFYLVPAFPYLAIGFSILVIPYFYKLIERIHLNNLWFKTFGIFSIVLIVCTIAISINNIGKFSREKETIHDVYEIGKIVPSNYVLSLPVEMYDQYDFVLQGFLVRYFNISLDPNQKYDYFIIKKTLKAKIPSEYSKVNIETQKFDLYKLEKLN